MNNAYWDYLYAQQVYNYLYAAIQNHYGVSGFLGNIYAESNICPFRCEDDFSQNYTVSYNATMNTIRTLTRQQFVDYYLPGHSSSQTGYSLAQWTYYTRKEAYYDYCSQSLLGDGQKSMEFLLYELQNDFSGVYNYLLTAPSVNAASDYVLEWYERPASWQSKIQERRGYSQNVYDDFSGQPPTPGASLPIWLIAKAGNNWRRNI